MFKPLSSVYKFYPGADIWLLFFEPTRDLFKHINWRTGWLLQNPTKQQDLTRPALISTKYVFPHKALLCLPFKKNLWLADIYKNWRQLNKPSLRVFMPLKISGESLNEYWPKTQNSPYLSYYQET